MRFDVHEVGDLRKGPDLADNTQFKDYLSFINLCVVVAGSDPLHFE